MTSFDLTAEPWIPCIDPKGRRIELGIRETLVGAHELRGIDDDSPLVVAALHRLLIAFVHRIVDGPRTMEDKRKLIRAGRFDAAAIDGYLDRWRSRLDLFDSQYPFYQVATLGDADGSAEPITRLLPERMCGNNATLFDHAIDDRPRALSPAAAARALLVYQSFDHGGKIPNESESQGQAPLRAGAIVLVGGDNLFATLALNTPRLDPQQALPIPGTSSDLPRWERDAAPTRTKRAPAGWLDLLTWPTRSVRLLRARDGTVARAYVRGGDQVKGDDVRDPMFAFRVSKDGLLAVRVSESKAVWRDSAPLFAASDSAGRSAQPPMSCIELTAEEGGDPVGFHPLRILGACADKAKVLLWRDEAIPYPKAFATNPDLARDVELALGRAETAARSLVWATRFLAERLLSTGIGVREPRHPDKKDIANVASSLSTEADYWAAQGAAFPGLILGLPADADAALATWIEAARRNAVRAFGIVQRRASGDLAGIRASALAERYFRGALKKALEGTPPS